MNSENPSFLIEANNISMQYHGQMVLHGINLRVSPGQIISLIGPNGAGKTTLVKVLLGLEKPTEGEVIKQADLRVAYLPQRIPLDSSFPITVKRFLQLGTAAEDKSIVAALGEAGVGQLGHMSMHNISGGELQRVLLARCLLRNPQLLVLDEPDQGMDTSGQRSLYSLIGEVRNRYNCGVLIVSHNLHLVMAATDQVICLQHHICCTGHPESITKHPEFLRLFGNATDGLAVYTHDHDHEHDLHGNIVND